MKASLIKVQTPKPNLRIRIPPQRPDEEILKSPVESPSPQMPAFLKHPLWMKKTFYGTRA